MISQWTEGGVENVYVELVTIDCICHQGRINYYLY